MLYALDLGNKQTKLKSEKMEKVLPSYFVETSLYGNRDFFASLKAKKDSKDFESINDQGYTYAWGTELGVESIGQVTDTSGFGLSRYTSREFQLLVDFALAELAYEEGTNNTVYVDVVTGLPSGDFKSTQILQAVAKAIKGVHAVSVNGTKINVCVEKLFIVPQPLGTIYNIIANEKGVIVDSQYLNANVGVVDIGGGTVLIDALKSMNLVDDNRDQLQTGAYSLYKSITTELSSSDIILTEYELERVIRLNSGLWSPNGNAEIDLNPAIQNQSKAYTRRLTSSIKTTYKGFGRMQKILLTGGTANLLDLDELKVELRGLAHIVEDSELANVRGFFKYGQQKVRDNV